MPVKFIEKNGEILYLIFRLLAGVLFFEHGAQKLLGWFTEGPPMQVHGLLALAGIIELSGGLMLALGVLTRIVAFVCAGEMLTAYYIAHLPRGWVPIQNKGELALLYFACFLIMLWMGGRKYSIDALKKRKDWPGQSKCEDIRA